MLQLFEEHTLKHYSYLRDTMPNLVPALKVSYVMQHNRMFAALIYTVTGNDLTLHFSAQQKKDITCFTFSV
jgi:hypothetical protein